jgi:hypothetical protein
MTGDDPFDGITLGDDEVWEHLAVVPRKIRKQRKHFVKVPWIWVEKLSKARYTATYRVALHLLYLDWKQKGGPVKLPNGMLTVGNVSKKQKWRALGELEHLGLIAVERRPRRSPLVTLIVSGDTGGPA